MTYTPATEKQNAFIDRLLNERELLEGDRNLVAHLRAQGGEQWSTKVASGTIDMLLSRPEKTKGNGKRLEVPGPDALPASRYAIENEDGELCFYEVWRGTRKPEYVKLYLQHGPDSSEVPFGQSMIRILHKIVNAGPAACALRYGHEIGSCSRCGIRLTNATSRALGIGPICGGHFYGEEFKSIVHGARMMLRESGIDPDVDVPEDMDVPHYDVEGDLHPNPHATQDGNAPTGVSAQETLAYVKAERLGNEFLGELDRRTDAEIESIIANAQRILEKRAFARREAEQERAAYTAKAARDTEFLSR